ncbi:hypothetical protein K470DRAFT_258403 [Piedraia hortae CBS 480.64]|uniref:Uncharacterized protein n=1 Tax=Piedraia hortae CBS 480.64 TaxID=1314780 RepID=A0A6A7BY10_9PEZI|nr:hypothetical protein K470DRAFT_258403 [Piedraia hortae CBS 480.64]
MHPRPWRLNQGFDIPIVLVAHCSHVARFPQLFVMYYTKVQLIFMMQSSSEEKVGSTQDAQYLYVVVLYRHHRYTKINVQQ